jgi:hypothetical protein
MESRPSVDTPEERARPGGPVIGYVVAIAALVIMLVA